MANRTEKIHWFGRDQLKKSQARKHKIPNINWWTFRLYHHQCSSSQACQISVFWL